MTIARIVRDLAVFAPCYVVLDWASYIEPLGPFNITPWNPQAGLALAWMLLGGLAQAPALAVTVFVADVLVREAPGGPALTALTALVLAAGYAGLAALLVRFAGRGRLGTQRELTAFVSLVLGGSAVVSAAFVGVLRAAQLLAGTPAGEAFVRFWIGDAVGILVTAPLLLAAADAGRRARLVQLARRRETLLQAGVLVATVWLIFYGARGDPAHHFYLLFVPLIWIAARGGMAGSIIATALVQLGVVAGIHREAVEPLPVLELQALVAALTLTGLYLGMMVDERRRAEAELAGSLRLAAAGEMAGAIAHEVNQPLTALTNYGRAAQMLLSRPASERPPLEEIVAKMLAEAERASDVVRRLRDFFRAGATRLEPLAVAEVLALGRRLVEQASAGRAIALESEAEPGLPALYVDRLQVELVLRNLVANAVESLSLGGRGTGRIRLVARRHDAGHVRFIVADDGPGIAAAQRERLFQPFASGKPTGMGLGLAVSRAIAEAHGGSLDTVAAAHGEFHLVLPCRRAA